VKLDRKLAHGKEAKQEAGAPESEHGAGGPSGNRQH
jgi:hypothetical protein